MAARKKVEVRQKRSGFYVELPDAVRMDIEADRAEVVLRRLAPIMESWTFYGRHGHGVHGWPTLESLALSAYTQGLLDGVQISEHLHFDGRGLS